MFSAIANTFVNITIFSWDVVLTLYNLVTPNLAKGKVVPAGQPGAGGIWPEYIPPKDGDSRSACPALNAMANHGKSISIIPLHTLDRVKNRHSSSRWPQY
jgi:hypothetical protein